MTFLNFKYTNQNLSNLTFATCLCGGLLWTTKYYNIQRKQITSKNYIDIVDLEQLDFYNSFSIKTSISIFYWYMAIYVNSFLLNFQVINIETLTKGYLVLMSSIIFDGLQYFYTYLNKDDDE